MSNKIFRKSLIIGIIILFIGGSVITNISGNIEQLSFSDPFIKHTIAVDFAGAASVYACDVDGDSDMDVLGAAQDDDMTYYWKIMAKDEHSAIKIGPVWHFTTEESENQPPTAPEISGDTNRKVGEEYCWTISSTDPDDDDIMYLVDWDDWETTETECYPSGQEVEVCHTYSEQGTYTIKVKAKGCPDGFESDWSELQVTMSRGKLLPDTFLIRLLERFPNAFTIMRLLFQGNELQ